MLFGETFFISGTERIILLAMCIAATVLTLAAIALVITVIVTAKRRKSGYVAEVSGQICEEAPDRLSGPELPNRPRKYPGKRPRQYPKRFSLETGRISTSRSRQS